MTISKIKRSVLKNCQDKKIIGFETGISFPVPLVFSHQKLYKFALYRSQLSIKNNNSNIFPAVNFIEVDANTLEITRQQGNSMTESPTPVGQYPNDMQATMLDGLDVDVLRNEFESLLELAIDNYFQIEYKGEEDSLDPEKKKRFNELFYMLVPEALLITYNDLNGHFFEIMGTDMCYFVNNKKTQQ